MDVSSGTAGKDGSGAQSVDRALVLLSLIGGGGGAPVPMTTLIEATGLSRPTVRRLMLALMRSGMVDQDDATRAYVLGPESYLLGLMARRRLDVLGAAMDSLQRLAEESGDNTYLSLRRGSYAVCAHREEGSYPIRTQALKTGDRHPLGVGAGAMAIPTMLERGYDKGLAAGTVASSGTLGILIPPSVMLVFMGDLLSISLGHLFVAALMPGLLLSLAYVIYIALRSALQPHMAPKSPPPTDEDRAGLLLEALKSVLAPLVMIIAVLGSILGGIATPTEASGVGVFAALLLGALRGRLTRETLSGSMDGSVKTLGMLFFIFIGATAFSYIFRKVGGEHFIVDTASALPFGNWGLLLAIMAMIFVMGFFFDWIEITLIMLPIFAPIIETMDLGDHVARSEMIYWFAILVALNLQTSFLTPPFGFALFYLKGAAGNLLSMRDIYRGIIPFVLLQLIVLGLAIAYPDLALWLPRLVFD